MTWIRNAKWNIDDDNNSSQPFIAVGELKLELMVVIKKVRDKIVLDLYLEN